MPEVSQLRRAPREELYGFAALGLVVGIGSPSCEDWIEVAREAEAAGLDMLAVGDGFNETTALMGALAARTRTVELISTIMSWTRTPVTTAQAGRTLQDLSGGRFRLGFGTMPREWSEQWHDIPADKPLARMRDYVAAVRAAGRARPGLPVSHQGPYYRFDGYEVRTHPHSPPAPISLAATRPRMSRLAGEVADGIAFNLINSDAYLREVLIPAALAGLEQSARTRGDLDLGVLRFCSIDADPAAARDRARSALGYYFTVPYLAEMLEHAGLHAELAAGTAAAQAGDGVAMAAAVSDAMIATFALAGTAADVQAQLRGYAGALDWVLLCPPLAETPEATLEAARRIIEAFGRAGASGA